MSNLNWSIYHLSNEYVCAPDVTKFDPDANEYNFDGVWNASKKAIYLVGLHNVITEIKKSEDAAARLEGNCLYVPTKNWYTYNDIVACFTLIRQRWQQDSKDEFLADDEHKAIDVKAFVLLACTKFVNTERQAHLVSEYLESPCKERYEQLCTIYNVDLSRPESGDITLTPIAAAAMEDGKEHVLYYSPLIL